jgi:hypothetical protein
MTPIAWALFNPATGKIDHRCYQREESARAGAAAHSNRWRTFVVVSDSGLTDDAVWLPKSQVEFDEVRPGIVEVTCPEWLATERGLI